jgi:hypothetical protein
MMKAIFKPENHEYFNESGVQYPSVSWLIDRYGYSNMDDVRGYVGDTCMDRAAEFGHILHETTVLDDQDRLGKCDPEIEPYLAGWRQFIADRSPKFISYEQPLLSKQGFAGTPDRIEDLGKFLAIVDIKSGVKTVAEEIQTAFYAILAEEHYGKPVKDRFSIHLMPFGYKRHDHKNKNDIMLARCILQLFNDQKRRGLIRWKTNS